MSESGYKKDTILRFKSNEELFSGEAWDCCLCRSILTPMSTGELEIRPSAESELLVSS